MFMSDSLSNIGAETRASLVGAGRLQRRSPSRKSLYRKLRIAAIGMAGWLALGAASHAQRPELKKPEQAPEETPPAPKPKKNVKGPRAIGVLQINASGKDMLIPVAILVEGKFYDASAYKADPVPMALERGTVYEVEKSGESQGLFTVRGALHSSNVQSAVAWMGSGSYVLNGAEVAKTTHRAEDKPRDLDSDDDAPPRLTRGKSETPTKTDSAAGSGGQGTKADEGNSGKGTGQKPEPASGSGKPAEGEAGGTTGQGSTAKEGSTTKQAPVGQQGSATPSGMGQGAGSQSPAAQETASSKGGESQEGGNYYRPTLRRGKPSEKAPDETEDVVATKASGSAGKAAGTDANVADKAQAQLIPAISDAGGPSPEPFVFFWKEGEEADREKQMLGVAANEVKAYVKAREMGAIPAKTGSTKTLRAKGSGSKSAVKSEPVFDQVQFRAFDLWKNNQPVMVLTAEAHLPPKAGTSESPFIYDVTIAARTDIYGDLRKLYAGVTDKFHLDVTPKLELIDAVDADGDGRGELLFREITDAGNGYLIYRATGDTLWKMFDSLKEEQ